MPGRSLQELLVSRWRSGLECTRRRAGWARPVLVLVGHPPDPGDSGPTRINESVTRQFGAARNCTANPNHGCKPVYASYHARTLPRSVSVPLAAGKRGLLSARPTAESSCVAARPESVARNARDPGWKRTSERQTIGHALHTLSRCT